MNVALQGVNNHASPQGKSVDHRSACGYLLSTCFDAGSMVNGSMTVPNSGATGPVTTGPTTTTTTAAAAPTGGVDDPMRLLNFSEPLDLGLLDRMVDLLYTGEGQEQRMALTVLTQLKEHPDAWTRVDTILAYSNNHQTKYYALQILETLIKTRWKVLPRDQCEGIKKFIVGLIIKTSTDAATMEASKVYLNKLNMILVQILKREWPRKWPTFIGDIVGSSKTNESLCQNNMIILKLLR